MKRKKITNYVKNKIALIKAEKRLDSQIQGKGQISIALMDEIFKLKKILGLKKR